jgi:fumarate reductase flavoprotein subunit
MKKDKVRESKTSMETEESAESGKKLVVTRRQFVTGTGLAGAALLSGYGLKEAKAAPIPKKWDMDADVVIMGFGGAGVCAAIEAAKAGASVLLLEKEEVPGGSTTISGGIVYAAGTKLQKSVGIEDSAEEMFKYVQACGQGKAVDALVKVASEVSAQNVDWLESLGCVFTKELLALSGMEEEPEYKAVTPPKKRGHRCKGMGSELFKALYNEVKAQKNVKIMLKTPAIRLITKPARTKTNCEVIGVAAKRGEKEINIFAKKAVILTSGGVMSSDETKPWLQDYSPDVALTVPAGSLSATGDGYRMGMACGAAMKGLNTGGFLPSVMFSGQKTAGIVYVNIWGLPNIYVKQNGMRFCDEGAYYVLVSEEMISNRATTAYCIIDSETLKKASDLVPKGIDITRTIALGLDPRNLEKTIQGGYVWKGDTVAELANKMGIDAAVSEKTISTYNKNAETGKDLEFNRKKGFAPLITPPYYGFKIRLGMVCHCGGLSINKKAQVLDTFNEVIPRLYAAGRDAIGIFGGRYPGSGGAISDFVTFGRIAGKTAAAEAPQKK